jgi:hypothetical protein
MVVDWPSYFEFSWMLLLACCSSPSHFPFLSILSLPFLPFSFSSFYLSLPRKRPPLQETTWSAGQRVGGSVWHPILVGLQGSELRRRVGHALSILICGGEITKSKLGKRISMQVAPLTVRIALLGLTNSKCKHNLLMSWKMTLRPIEQCFFRLVWHNCPSQT